MGACYTKHDVKPEAPKASPASNHRNGVPEKKHQHKHSKPSVDIQEGKNQEPSADPVFAQNPFALIQLTHDAICIGLDEVRDLALGLEKNPKSAFEKLQPAFKELERVVTVHEKQEGQLFFPLISQLFDGKKEIIQQFNKGHETDKQLREKISTLLEECRADKSKRPELIDEIKNWEISHKERLKHEENELVPLTKDFHEEISGQANFVIMYVDVDREEFANHQLGYITSKLNGTKFNFVRLWVDSVRLISTEEQYLKYVETIKENLPKNRWEKLERLGYHKMQDAEKPEPPPSPEKKPKSGYFHPSPFDLWRLTHEGIRGGMQEIERIIENHSTVGVFKAALTELTATIEVLNRQEEGVFFPMLDNMFDNAVSNAGFYDELKGDHRALKQISELVEQSKDISIETMRESVFKWTESHEKLLQDEESVINPLIDEIDQPLEGLCSLVKDIVNADRSGFLHHQLPYVTTKLASMGKDFQVLRSWVDAVKRTSSENQYREYTRALEKILGGENWIKLKMKGYDEPPTENYEDDVWNVVIIGAGLGGLSVAYRLNDLLKREPNLKEIYRVTLIEKNSYFMMKSSYLSIMQHEMTEEENKFSYNELVMEHIDFKKVKVEEIDCEAREICFGDGTFLTYDELVIACGTHGHPQSIPGLEDNSIEMCNYKSVIQLGVMMQNFEGGDILICVAEAQYTHPPLPYEYAFIIDGILRDRNVREQTTITVATPKATGAPELSPETIQQLLAEKDITFKPKLKLRSVDGQNGAGDAIFEHKNTKKRHRLHFDLMIAMYPQRGYDFISVCDELESNAKGLIPTHHQSLRTKVQSVYAIGDCTNIVLPDRRKHPKTAQFAVSQGRLVAANILEGLEDEEKRKWNVPPTFIQGSLEGDEIATCYAETGNETAVAIEIDLYGDQSIVEVSGPSPKYHQLRREWIRSQLRTFFREPTDPS